MCNKARDRRGRSVPGRCLVSAVRLGREWLEKRKQKVNQPTTIHRRSSLGRTRNETEAFFILALQSRGLHFLWALSTPVSEHFGQAGVTIIEKSLAD